MRPETSYAKSDDLQLAYQVFGEGPLDLILVAGFFSHVELAWEHAPAVKVFERLASFARVIVFDRRGMGMSDPVLDVPTLEERMDDVRAVMDAAGSERAVLLGHSEGAPMSILFAATYPERVEALVLYSALARSTADDDYDIAPPREAFVEASRELIAPHWGEGATIEVAAPSVADDPDIRAFHGRMERQSASPAMAAAQFEMFLDIDVRDVLASVHVPTLVIHRHGDRVVNVHAGRWLAEHIEGAKFVELAGSDHNYWYDSDDVFAEIEEFLLGSRPAPAVDRALRTVLFTDVVDSTRKAAARGDRTWRELLTEHQTTVRRQVDHFGGEEVKTLGDGFLLTFDGPARAISCASAIIETARRLDLDIRAGIHTGECELMGSDIAGMAVHIASRVSALAGPGEILVSRTVKDLVVGSGMAFEDRGEHLLKGVPDPWHLYEVTGLPT